MTKLFLKYKKEVHYDFSCCYNIESLGYIISLSNRNINGRNSAHLLLSPGESSAGVPETPVQGYFVESASYKNPLSHNKGPADIS